ncbi:MAG: hypothetical protein ACXW25_04350 [Rhodospirillales bacterium]
MVTSGRVVLPNAGLALLAALALAAPCSAGVPAPPVAQPAAVALPRLPAPLGLSFGMRPEEVALPMVVPPAPPGTVVPLRAPLRAPSAGPPHAGAAPAPRPLFPSAAAVAATPPVPLDGLGDYLRACEAVFDGVSALAAGDREWLAWRAQHLQGGEGSDFTDDLADRAGLTVAPVPALVTRADGWRSAGLYRFDGADGRRLVCLLFTDDGLAQVFLAGHALDGLRDQVVAHLDDRRGLEGFALTREARRFSLSLQRPACGLYCRLFGERMLVERRLWLDPGARILVAAKRGVVVSGLTGAFAGGEGEVFDGLPESFLASIDLRRRAFVLRQPATATRATPPGAGLAAAVFAPPPTGPSRQALIESFVP